MNNRLTMSLILLNLNKKLVFNRSLFSPEVNRQKIYMSYVRQQMKGVTMGFILTFDIPREMKTLQRQVQRNLHRINAEMLQFSVWKSEKLQELIKIALLIKQNGGSAKY